jgi:hypothetical protein
MNISDYSTKVKNLADVLTSIGARVDDEDLVVVTLNGLVKDYSQLCTSIAILETFFNFQNLITLFISEEIKLLVFHPIEEHNKMFSIQILMEMVKPHFDFEVDMEARMVDIINMKVNLMEVDEDTLEEEEVVEVVVEVIKVNNQISTQTTTTTRKLGT